MDYDAYPICIVGLRVDPAELQRVLYREEKQRACSCFDEVPKSKFCSECGGPIWKNVKIPIEGYEYKNEELFGFKLRCRSSEYWEPEYISTFITEYCGSRRSGMLNLTGLDIPSMMQRMKTRLEPLGIWYDNNFGIHIYMYGRC